MNKITQWTVNLLTVLILVFLPSYSNSDSALFSNVADDVTLQWHEGYRYVGQHILFQQSFDRLDVETLLLELIVVGCVMYWLNGAMGSATKRRQIVATAVPVLLTALMVFFAPMQRFAAFDLTHGGMVSVGYGILSPNAIVDMRILCVEFCGLFLIAGFAIRRYDRLFTMPQTDVPSSAPVVNAPDDSRASHSTLRYLGLA
ncbi:MAG: hypothetical protein JSS75_12660 [Bacteroidetes bacterium]|nr:hypothetical protein [Bacteroidota bacterium]